MKKGYFTKLSLALAMRRFSIMAGSMMIVFVAFLCVSSNASAQGQGQSGGPAIFSWYDNGYGAVSTTGSIQIGDGGVDCDSTTAGTIRYTGTDFEGCHDGAWVSLTASGSDHVRYAIGDTGPAGGIVFYIAHSGLHGLEAAPADQGGSNVKWGCYGIPIVGADGTAVGTGAQNTADILAGCSESGIAAELADDYTLNGYYDWFLPSKEELVLLSQQQDVVRGFIASYWSSSEYDSDNAWGHNFLDSFSFNSPKDGTQKRVRAVRAF